MAVSRKLRSILLGFVLLLPALAGAEPGEDEINVVGLSSGKAVVVLGGSAKPRVLHDGETLTTGVKLVKATPEMALFEINGQRRSLPLGSSQLSSARSSCSLDPRHPCFTLSHLSPRPRNWSRVSLLYVL